MDPQTDGNETYALQQSNLPDDGDGDAQHESDVVKQLRRALDGLMTVDDITVLSNVPQPPVQFGGHISDIEDADVVFEKIVQRFEALGYTPFLANQDDAHVLQALPIVFDHKPKNAWINGVLFLATVVSVIIIGAIRELNALPTSLQDCVRGIPFAFAFLSILTTHELSHYFVGRRYGSPLSLPFFIPMPLGPLGTMGAVIVQKSPMHSRKALFDIGAAGPIGGLLVAVPLLFLGLMFTQVGHPSEFMDLSNAEGLSQEGNSLLYLAAKYIVFGRILPDPATGEDVWLSPPSTGGAVVFAAWAGLLVTALNLLPIGQLDGGHIMYALWGRKAWRIARTFVLLCFIWGVSLLTVGNSAGLSWLIWGALGTLMGPRHPPPLNDLVPLDPRRKVLAWLMILIFFLIIIPLPFVEVSL